MSRNEYRLRAFFALGTIETNSGGPLSRLTTERAQAFYDDLRKTSAVDTHRNCLTLAKAFGVRNLIRLRRQPRSPRSARTRASA